MNTLYFILASCAFLYIIKCFKKYFWTIQIYPSHSKIIWCYFWFFYHINQITNIIKNWYTKTIWIWNFRQSQHTIMFALIKFLNHFLYITKQNIIRQIKNKRIIPYKLLCFIYHMGNTLWTTSLIKKLYFYTPMPTITNMFLQIFLPRIYIYKYLFNTRINHFFNSMKNHWLICQRQQMLINCCVWQ